jgi:hypothetical protein
MNQIVAGRPGKSQDVVSGARNNDPNVAIAWDIGSEGA